MSTSLRSVDMIFLQLTIHYVYLITIRHLHIIVKCVPRRVVGKHVELACMCVHVCVCIYTAEYLEAIQFPDNKFTYVPIVLVDITGDCAERLKTNCRKRENDRSSAIRCGLGISNPVTALLFEPPRNQNICNVKVTRKDSYAYLHNHTIDTFES